MGVFLLNGIVVSSISEAMIRARTRQNIAAERLRLEKQHSEYLLRAQHQLEDSEHRFRALFENSPTGIVVADPASGRFLKANRLAVQMYGYNSEDELLGKTISEITYPDDLDETRRHNEQLASGAIDHFFGEKRYVRKDGSHFWAQANITRVKDTDSAADLFIGNFIDITQRKQAEHELIESRERLQLLIDHAPAALAMFDREMRYLAVSRRWLTDYSLEGQDIIGRSHYDIFPEIPEHWKAFHRRAQSGEVVRAEEDSFERADGTVQWLRWEIRPWHTPDKHVGGIVIFTEDITERRHAQDQLRIWGESFEQAGFGLAIADAVTNSFVAVNPTFAREHGYEREELVGQPVMTVFPADMTEQVKNMIAALNTESHIIFESEHLRKDGRRFPILLDVTSIKSAEGAPLSRIVYTLDITERKRDQQKIVEYVKQLEESMQGTLQAVSNMVEQRDPYTAGHERRVGIIAADIAREMSWPEEKCNELQLIGLVHDIGKIGVPAEILTKPGRLTSVEYDLVKEHVVKGYEILKDVKFPLPIAEIIYQHHERMDGSGYPRGLQGKDILPEARILAVADVLESMASYRPYRPALGTAAALKEITDHRDILYDASVVDALLRLVHEKAYQLPS